jgi:hypothetical protein
MNIFSPADNTCNYICGLFFVKCVIKVLVLGNSTFVFLVRKSEKVGSW